MAPPPCLIAGRVVPPFAEYLSAKAVPVPVKQRLLLRLAHHRKAGKVFGIVLQKRRVVEYCRGNKYPVPLHLDFSAVRCLHAVAFPYRCLGWCRRDESALYPSMPDAAGVSRCPHVYSRSLAAWSVSGEKIAVFVPCEMCQLVKADKIKFLPLVFDFVLRMM